jgi:hypothetical protein
MKDFDEVDPSRAFDEFRLSAVNQSKVRISLSTVRTVSVMVLPLTSPENYCVAGFSPCAPVPPAPEIAPEILKRPLIEDDCSIYGRVCAVIFDLRAFAGNVKLMCCRPQPARR